jgi:four helix bundle protein
MTQGPRFKKDYALTDQIRRAAVSVMSNIAEGFGRGGNKEFAQYLFIAKGSLAEVRSILYVAKDLKYIDDTAFTTASTSASELNRIIAGLIKSIRNRQLSDLKSL